MSFFKQFENSIDIDRSDENLFSMTPSKDYFVGNTPHGGVPHSGNAKSNIT